MAAGVTGGRWRPFASAAVSSAILFGIWTAPVNAAGPLYAVPNHPPSETKSVDFTNALNHRVRHLPPPLDPPTADTPAEVEARLQVLQGGVVLEGGTTKPKASPAAPYPAAKPKTKTVKEPAAEEPGDRAPLSMAFVGAGALAFLGLLLTTRGRLRSG